LGCACPLHSIFGKTSWLDTETPRTATEGGTALVASTLTVVVVNQKKETVIGDCV